MLIIFDLDGTLIDSARDLAIAANATRHHYGMAPLPEDLIQSYVGNGAAVLVKRVLGADTSDERAAEGLQFFVKYYRAHALEHTQLYAGVKEAVEELAADGHKLAVLTNKPVKISTDILHGLGLGARFQKIYGGDSFAQKKPDPVGITTLLGDTASAAADTWMVGDSGVDIQTARNAGVYACGVAWGFQPETFETYPPDFVVHEPRELVELFQFGPAKL